MSPSETIDCVLRFCYGQRQYRIPWQSAIDNGESEPEPKFTEPDADRGKLIEAARI
jgi:hypothetical protein